MTSEQYNTIRAALDAFRSECENEWTGGVTMAEQAIATLNGLYGPTLEED